MGTLERIGSKKNNTDDDLKQLKDLYQRYTISLYRPQFSNQSTQSQVNELYDRLSVLNENQLKRITPSALQQEKEIKFESIDENKASLPRVLPIQFRDNNSTQSGLDLARISKSSGLSDFLSEVSAIQKAPPKTQQQIYRDLIREPLSFEQGSTTKYVPPKKSNTYDESLSLSQNLDRTTPKFKILPQKTLLDTIAEKPKPPERNLLGQTFSAFSDLLSGTRDTRDALAYGGVALGAFQPELIPAIGLAETGNQALNIIEAPVNAIELAIQKRINRPPPIKTYRTDAYGNRFALNP